MSASEAGSGVTTTKCRIFNPNEIECETFENDHPGIRMGNKEWCSSSESVLTCTFDTKSECNHSFLSAMARFGNNRKVCVKNPDIEDE
jgi:hypothetical protein